MRFEEITGHQKEIERLRSFVDTARLPHALLLHGPSGVGKTMVARALIQYICCTNRKDGDSCGVCPSCRQIAALNHPDIHYVYPILKKSGSKNPLCTDYIEEWKQFLADYPFMPEDKWLDALDSPNGRPVIYVSEAQEILRVASLSSYGAGLKIFLVWQPEKLHADAANRLLKMIEEPFSDTLFVFVSNNPGAILPTIKSRLQSVAFKSVSENELVSYFTKEGFEPAMAADLAKVAQGNMNNAYALAHDAGEQEQFTHDFINVMRACYGRKIVELKKLADSFAGYGREKALRLLTYFARMTRESFMSNLKSPELIGMTREEAAFVVKFGPFIHAANVEEMIREYDSASNDISRNANQKIVWFDLLLTLCRLIRLNNTIR